MDQEEQRRIGDYLPPLYLQGLRKDDRQGALRSSGTVREAAGF